ncbi:MAG: hypothetical protein A2513_09030 [Sulfurimonas sp. RIFOXYD12_FULL_33_39]|uniref:DUF2202 domain-containing protein n=1 Tax=unclassified Sulfurimonas TaxID=2623549 RepID=UPI0008BE49A5|nr:MULTISPECIES: DUF2202 domain-containing protein [unclassified Sulfurimonas]OHE10223.1 MAG: hypothetical protein A2513_09030 [Sulfurimonas sp. RIFOXYD12_FULL_33_39]OHE14556.1 MAG: hypothetical protein A2530_01450 [Sulfurimonas sp. RIFOXYD2_FULL_34_21]DAB28319.1 MAG TPA: hypothetical protein CFH78_02995 [Sulfurimonas sp. UBA10385]
MGRGFGQSGFGGGFSGYSGNSISSFGGFGYGGGFSGNGGGFGYGRSPYFSNEALSVSESEAQSLLYVIEKEKMMHEIYVELSEQTELDEFDFASFLEGRQYDKLLFTADRLDVDTSSLSTETGVFSNAEIQNIYDTLMLEASVSTEAAVNVAIYMEESAIAELEVITDNTESILLERVYFGLENSSLNQINIFESIA